jgi:Transglycosylase SLT domain
MDRRLRYAVSVLACVLTFLGGSVAPGQVSGAGQVPNSTCIYSHEYLWSQPGTCRPQALAYPKDVKGRVRQAIYDSAETFGVPYAVLLRIARCESALNPRATDGTHFGLYQFLPGTFHGGTRSMRSMTGIQASNLWKASDSAYVAGFLFAIGHSPAWQCR